MLKRERLGTIKNLVDRHSIMTVNQISESLGVSTMTIRRDLDELADANLLVRIHGGARSVTNQKVSELSRIQKGNLNIEEKDHIAKIAASLIEPGDTVYIGPGTTNELIADHLTIPDVRIITNSLPIFQGFQERSDQFSLQLIGGSYRARSGAFIGSLANEVLARLRTNKSFISINGIDGNSITNANPEEGQTQRIALNSSDRRYVLADTSKLNKKDFYNFYELDKADALITNPHISVEDRAMYSQFTKVITQFKK